MEQYFRNRVSVDDDPHLARDRRANDARLKSRFEHIFAKYGKDFDGIGDEIDLETGEVHVNNGHLENMRHEVDPGKGGSSQVLRVFGNSLDKSIAPVGGSNFTGEEIIEEDEEDGEDEEDEDDESSSLSDKSGYSSSSSAIDDEENGFGGIEPYPQNEPSSDSDAEETHVPSTRREPRSAPPAPQYVARESVQDGQRGNDGHGGYQQLDAPRVKESGNMPLDMPLLQRSLGAIQTNSGQNGTIDPDIIQALGSSIANQLARFMAGVSKGKSKKKKRFTQSSRKDHPWEYPSLPGDRRERTPGVPLAPEPMSSSAAMFSESPGGQASIWAPVHIRPHKRRRSDRLEQTAATEIGDVEANPLQSDLASSSHTKQSDKARETCSNCGDTESSNFRNGPEGRLCNPCGMYYYRYGLLKSMEGILSSRKRKRRTGASSVQAPSIPGQPNNIIDEFDIPVTPLPGTTPRYTANTGRRLSGRKPREPFTAEEEDRIIRLREVDRLTWSAISRVLSNRSGPSIQSHHRRLSSAPGYNARLQFIEKNLPPVTSLAIENQHMNDSRTPAQDGPLQPSDNPGTISSPVEPEPDVLSPVEQPSEEDARILEMRDEEHASSEEEVLQQRHDHLGRYEQHVKLATQGSSDVSSRSKGGPKDRSVNFLLNDLKELSDRMQMPPPPRPDQMLIQRPIEPSEPINMDSSEEPILDAASLDCSLGLRSERD